MTQLQEEQLAHDRLMKRLRMPKTRLDAFNNLPANEQGFVLLQQSRHIQNWIVDRLSNRQLLDLLRYLDPDQATDILQLVDSPRAQKRLLKKLTDDIRDQVEFLLPFHKTSAAGIMNLNYIEVLPSATIEQVARKTKTHERRTGKFPTILVVNRKGTLIGEIASHYLITSPKDTRTEALLHKPPTISFAQDVKKAVKRLTESTHRKIIVLGDDRSIMGVIYSDDLLRALRKESSQSLYDFAGVQEEEDAFDPVGRKVKRRYKWLLLNLATAFMAAGVVSLFEGTISEFVFLAAYMPIVAGMGGNAATQTLAVTVRSISSGEIDLASGSTTLLREVGAGLLNGLLIGIIVAVIATLWNQSPVFGFVIGVAMLANLFVAAFFGTLIPLILKRLGADPATSATVFITTTTDILGFLVFLGLATLLLP